MACDFILPNGEELNEKELKAYLLNGKLKELYDKGLIDSPILKDLFGERNEAAIEETEIQETNEPKESKSVKKAKEINWTNFKLKIAEILESNKNYTAEEIINIRGEKDEKAKQIIRDMVAARATENDRILAQAKEFIDKVFSEIEKGKAVSQTAINLSKSKLADLVDYIGEQFIKYDVINNSKLEKFADEAIKMFGNNYEAAIEHINNSGKLVSAKPILLAKIAVKLNEDGKGKIAAKIMEQLLQEANMTGRTLQAFKRVNEILDVRGTSEYKTEMAKRIVEKAKEISDKKIAEMERIMEIQMKDDKQKIDELKQQLNEIRKQNHKTTFTSIKEKMDKLLSKICNFRRK